MPEFASRSTFLSGLKRRYASIDLPVSGLTVRYQSLSEAEQSAYEMATWTRNDDGTLVRNDEAVGRNRSRLIVLCVVDEGGNRMLTDADLPQVDLLDGADTRALYQVLQEHCGMIEVEKKKGSSVSSATSPGASSTTASP